MYYGEHNTCILPVDDLYLHTCVSNKHNLLGRLEEYASRGNSLGKSHFNGKHKTKKKKLMIMTLQLDMNNVNSFVLREVSQYFEPSVLKPCYSYS